MNKIRSSFGGLRSLGHEAKISCANSETNCLQERITRSLQLPHIPVTAFSQTDLFSLVWIYLEFRSPQERQWPICNHKHGLMLTCRHVHVSPHFILTEVCSCRLELAYFAGKMTKNRLVCKNAVALAYYMYGSCRLLVMGPCCLLTKIRILKFSRNLVAVNAFFGTSRKSFKIVPLSRK